MIWVIDYFVGIKWGGSLGGNFKNDGKEYHKKGSAPKVLDHDFPIEELGWRRLTESTIFLRMKDL